MAPVDTKYYDLLGVKSASTEAELRTAYKKKALQLHPDKGGDPEQFQQMKEAYDVLSDPQKRKMYDRYGCEGIRLMEGDLRPEHMMVMLSRSGKCIVVLLLATVTSAILLPIIFFALRWDATVTWPWFCALIPTWVIHAFLLTFVLCVVRAPPPEEDKANWDDTIKKEYAERQRFARNVRLSTLLFHSLLITFEVFVALRAEGSVDWSWIVVIVPWILVELVMLIMTVLKSPQAWTNAKMEANRNKMVVPPPGFKCYLLQSVEWGILRVVMVFLLAARADGSFDGSWFLCLIPVFVGSFGDFVSAMLVKLRFRAALARQKAQTDQAGQEDIEEPGGGLTGVCCTVGFFLIMACGAAAKFGGTTYSAFLVFLPLLIVVVCCGFCLPACLVVNQKPDDAAAAQAAAQAGAGGPGPNVVGATEQEQAMAEAALIHAIFAAAAEQALAESERTAAAEAAMREAGVPASQGGANSADVERPVIVLAPVREPSPEHGSTEPSAAPGTDGAGAQAGSDPRNWAGPPPAAGPPAQEAGEV